MIGDERAKLKLLTYGNTQIYLSSTEHYIHSLLYLLRAQTKGHQRLCRREWVSNINKSNNTVVDTRMHAALSLLAVMSKPTRSCSVQHMRDSRRFSLPPSSQKHSRPRVIGNTRLRPRLINGSKTVLHCWPFSLRPGCCWCFHVDLPLRISHPDFHFSFSLRIQTSN